MWAEAVRNAGMGRGHEWGVRARVGLGVGVWAGLGDHDKFRRRVGDAERTATKGAWVKPKV